MLLEKEVNASDLFFQNGDQLRQDLRPQPSGGLPQDPARVGLEAVRRLPRASKPSDLQAAKSQIRRTVSGKNAGCDTLEIRLVQELSLKHRYF